MAEHLPEPPQSVERRTDVDQLRRLLPLVVTVVAVAACSQVNSPSPQASTASTTPASTTAADGTGELLITTHSYLSCPQIGPSPKAECGFLPVPKVTIEITSNGSERTTVRTGDDGTVELPVSPGVLTVTGAAVAEYSWTPEPVTIEISPGEAGDVVLVYSDGPQIPPPPN
ncbi:MAG TPA: hypothetical protein VHI11_08930 [Jiangellaceae bacterium]|nr:hypothetical protein [Jiangellaceae bacterium]